MHVFQKIKTLIKKMQAFNFVINLVKMLTRPAFILISKKTAYFMAAAFGYLKAPHLAKFVTVFVITQKKWQAVIENEDIINTFGAINGDGLKRPPRGYDVDHKYIEDLKRKSFFAMKNENDYKITHKADFIDEVVKTFEAASPLMAFICDAKGIEF